MLRGCWSSCRVRAVTSARSRLFMLEGIGMAGGRLERFSPAPAGELEAEAGGGVSSGPVGARWGAGYAAATQRLVA